MLAGNVPVTPDRRVSGLLPHPRLPVTRRRKAHVEKGELIPNLLSPAGLACQGSPPALSRRIYVHAVLKQMGSGQRSSWFNGRCQICVESQANLPRGLACSHYLASLRTTLKHVAYTS